MKKKGNNNYFLHLPFQAMVMFSLMKMCCYGERKQECLA